MRSFAVTAGAVILAAVASSLVAAPAPAQSVPAGWHTFTEKSGSCTMSVPPDWTVTPGVMPDAVKTETGYHAGLMMVIPKVQPSFADQMAQAKHSWGQRQDFTAVEESATRAIYRFRNAGAYQWQAIAAGPVACSASLNAATAGDPLIMQIIGTLHSAK